MNADGNCSSVIPAQAGMTGEQLPQMGSRLRGNDGWQKRRWIPAQAGMTDEELQDFT
jgi:hypothetical protein